MARPTPILPASRAAANGTDRAAAPTVGGGREERGWMAHLGSLCNQQPYQVGVA